MAALRTVVIVGAGLALGLCACSSGGSGTRASTPAAPPATTSSTAAVSPSQSLNSAAESAAPSTSTGSSATASSTAAPSALQALVVQPADLTGYTGDGKGEAKNKPDDDSSKLPACMGVQDPNTYFQSEYDSQEFSNSTNTVSIDSDITKYSSTKAVDLDRALIADGDKLTACFKKEAASEMASLPKGTTFDAVQVIKAASSLPSNILGEISARFTVPDNGKSVLVYIEDVLIVGKTVDESLTVTGIGQPATPAVVQQLATVVAGRIANV